MKLMNFRSLDPAYDGRGLSAGGQGDRAVWEDFHGEPKRLAATAAAIRSVLKSGVRSAELEFAEAEAIEGSVLTRLHRERERDERLVKLKKAAVLKRDGVLACEACAFVFGRTYGKRGADFIECHHVLPLSALGAARKTKLDDLALLCANCHRMIHVTRPWLTIAELRAIVNAAPSDANPI